MCQHYPFNQNLVGQNCMVFLIYKHYNEINNIPQYFDKKRNYYLIFVVLFKVLLAIL